MSGSSGFYVTVENVVASGDIGCRVSLEKAVKAYPGAYRTRGFPAVAFKFRSRKLKASVLVFKNGRLICSGARSVEDALKALKKTVNILRAAGIKTGKFEAKIENIVASCGLGLEYNMDVLAETLPRSLYEPDYFPGLVYRMENPKTVVLIFPRGKAVVAGLKTEEEIYKATKNLRQTIQKILQATTTKYEVSLGEVAERNIF